MVDATGIAKGISFEVVSCKQFYCIKSLLYHYLKIDCLSNTTKHPFGLVSGLSMC